jgi:hypothetical protein
MEVNFLKKAVIVVWSREEAAHQYKFIGPNE